MVHLSCLLQGNGTISIETSGFRYDNICLLNFSFGGLFKPLMLKAIGVTILHSEFAISRFLSLQIVYCCEIWDLVLSVFCFAMFQMCHKHGVMHRDLKPENFLFGNKKETAPLKAIDFGLSVFFKPGNAFG